MDVIPAVLNVSRGGAQGKKNGWLTRQGWMDEVWIERKWVKENRKKINVGRKQAMPICIDYFVDTEFNVHITKFDEYFL